MLYSYRLGGDECQWENKLVPSSETYLCSMQGHMCRIATLRGKSPPGKIGKQAAKDIKYGPAWLDMRQDRAIWLILKVREANIRLNEAGKAHDNAITTWHTGVRGKYASKRSRGV